MGRHQEFGGHIRNLGVRVGGQQELGGPRIWGESRISGAGPPGFGGVKEGLGGVPRFGVPGFRAHPLSLGAKAPRSFRVEPQVPLQVLRVLWNQEKPGYTGITHWDTPGKTKINKDFGAQGSPSPPSPMRKRGSPPCSRVLSPWMRRSRSWCCCRSSGGTGRPARPNGTI